jgi:hypothetical protein
VRPRQLPMTPPRIWALLREASVEAGSARA